MISLQPRNEAQLTTIPCIAPDDIFSAGVKAADFFLVEPEKALLDTLYMKSKGLSELLPEDVDGDPLPGDIDVEVVIVGGGSRSYSDRYDISPESRIWL